MNKWTNVVMDDGRVHPIAITLFFLVNHLWWITIMDDSILDEKSHLVSDIYCNAMNL